MAKDLRTFMDEVAHALPDQFLTLDREVDPRYELSAVLRRLELDGRLPMVRFEQVAGTDFPVLSNVFAHRDRIELPFGTGRAGLAAEFQQRADRLVPPVRVPTGPVKDVVLTGPEVDVTRLPQIVHAEQNAGPYLTAAVGVVRDPRTGISNAGVYRVQMVGPRVLRVNVGPGSHLLQLQAAQEQRDQPLDIALAIGHYPTFMMASQYRGPLDFDEIELAGALAGEPVRMAPAETLDVDVPVDSEIVVEARILPGSREVEAPFVEYAQFVNPGQLNPVAEVTAITHRADAVFHDILAGRADHNTVGVPAREARLLARARAVSAAVTAVALPASGCCRFTAYIAMDDPPPGLARNVGLAVLGADPALKLAVMVNRDVDVHAESDVLWAVATRLRAEHDVLVLPGMRVTGLDPSAYAPHSPQEHGPLNAKVLVDATVPSGAPTHARGDVPPDLLHSAGLLEGLRPYRTSPPAGTRQR